MNAPNVTDKDPKFVERQIPRGEHQIYVRDYAGTEPAFVLVHGFPDNLGIYDRLAPLLAEAGHKRWAIEYLLGNHAIAETIYRHDPAVAQYVPLRCAIYELEGGTRFVIEQPSRALASLGTSEISEVGAELDRKLANLFEVLGIQVATALSEARRAA